MKSDKEVIESLMKTLSSLAAASYDVVKANSFVRMSGPYYNHPKIEYLATATTEAFSKLDSYRGRK